MTYTGSMLAALVAAGFVAGFTVRDLLAYRREAIDEERRELARQVERIARRHDRGAA
jgi:hypothetical protein